MYGTEWRELRTVVVEPDRFTGLDGGVGALGSGDLRIVLGLCDGRSKSDNMLSGASEQQRT